MRATMFLLAMIGCAAPPGRTDARATDNAVRRQAMVDEQIARRGVTDRRVLDAMNSVPREEFVPAAEAPNAYADFPLPIGYGQTISQPYIVAFMTEALQIRRGMKVLEIGTASGYQAAVLAQLGADVYTIEIVPELASRARSTLARLGLDRVHVRAGDGYRGWPEAAPFDRIIVTAAPDHIPQPLIDQLAVGGRMVVPVGKLWQQITVVRKSGGGVTQEKSIDVVFVPMTGEAQGKK